MGWGNENLFAGSGSHVHILAYGKQKSLKIFFGTDGPNAFKLGMQHRGLGPIIVCTNDEQGLTLTFLC